MVRSCAISQFAVEIVSPGPDRAIRLERQAVTDTSGDRDDASQPAPPTGCVALTCRAILQFSCPVASPGPDRAIRLERQAVKVTCGDCDDICHSAQGHGTGADDGCAIAYFPEV